MKWDEIMIKFLNKLLSRFKLQVVPQKEPEELQVEEESLVSQAVKFLDSIPKESLGEVDMSGYIGDINYLKDKDGKTYYKDLNTKKYFCDYDLKNPSKEVLGHMIAETTFTEDELKEKLND